MPSINATIRHLGLKLLAARCGNRYLGYSYFVSLKDGGQVGDSVMVYRQNQLTLEQWLEQAKAVAKELPENSDRIAHVDSAAAHRYEVQVSAVKSVLIDANTRSQAAKIAAQLGYTVWSMNMVG